MNNNLEISDRDACKALDETESVDGKTRRARMSRYVAVRYIAWLGRLITTLIVNDEWKIRA